MTVSVIVNFGALTLSEPHYPGSSHLFLPLPATLYKLHHEPSCVSRRPYFLENQKHQTFPFRPHSSPPEPTLAFFLPLPIREVLIPAQNYSHPYVLDSNLVGLHQKKPTFLMIPCSSQTSKIRSTTNELFLWYSDPYVAPATLNLSWPHITKRMQ